MTCVFRYRSQASLLCLLVDFRSWLSVGRLVSKRSLVGCKYRHCHTVTTPQTPSSATYLGYSDIGVADHYARLKVKKMSHSPGIVNQTSRSIRSVHCRPIRVIVDIFWTRCLESVAPEFFRCENWSFWTNAHRAARFAHMSAGRAYLWCRAGRTWLGSGEGFRVGAPRRRQWTRWATLEKRFRGGRRKTKRRSMTRHKSPYIGGVITSEGWSKRPKMSFKSPISYRAALGVAS